MDIKKKSGKVFQRFVSKVWRGNEVFCDVEMMTGNL